MKSLFPLLLFCCSLVFAHTDKDKKGKSTTQKKEVKNIGLSSKNFHSVKNWKMTIEFRNGEIKTKVLSLPENNTLSTMEIAFQEAEKHARNLKNMKGYEVAPISSNNYVLLANN